MTLACCQHVRRLLLLAAATLACAATAWAVDGFVVTVHYELPAGKLGNIHDGSTPGKLLRYDIRNDQTVGTKVLYAKDEVGWVCLSPFGDRVAFTKSNGMIAVMPADGGTETDLVSFIGDEKPKPGETPVTGLQWPPSEGGKWLYYMDGRNGGGNNALRRVNVETKEDQFVVRFNRAAGGSFALTPDATPHSGHYVKRTDNYVIAIYDLARGDGDLFNCPRTGGCGESVSPDGSLLTANNGWHTGVSLCDMTGAAKHEFRLNQWDGDPCNPALGKTREQTEWAWQSFRWSANAVNWIAVYQGKLKVPSTHETYFQDAVLYDWVNKRQVNVTRHPPGQFERVGGFWESGAKQGSLGLFSGEAPLTVEITDGRLTGAWRWECGDGSAPTDGPAPFQHTFATAGTFTLTATQGDQVYKAQVLVQPRRAPTAVCQYVNPQTLLVDFSEPVRLAPGFAARLKRRGPVATTVLNETGRRLTVRLPKPLTKNDGLILTGVEDLAQVPNPLPPQPIPVTVAPWPANRQDLVYLWEDNRTLNAIYDDKAQTVNEFRVSRDRGLAGIDRIGRMRLDDGLLTTGFFSQQGAQMQFRDLILADAFSLEVTLQPLSLTRTRPTFPARIVNCSAWHDGDWEFMLGQQADRILFSIRTTENMLNMDGKPIKGDLHGRAPAYEIATLPDAAPHHLVVTYVPGHLTAYLDGRQCFTSEAVKGSLKAWGYGELCFGSNHNGGRYGWLGRIEGVAIYKRALPADEVRRNAKAYAAKRQARPVLPQIEVEAKVVAVSQVPEPKKIAPYTDALVINEYQVTRVAKSAKGWKLTPALAAGSRFRVAQWGVLEARKTELTELKAGDIRTLTLEKFDRHPEKLDEMVTSSALPDEAEELPLLYEPRP